MPQDLEYPLLSAASYERPPTPTLTNTSDDQLLHVAKAPQAGNRAPMSPPDSPVKRVKAPSSVATTAVTSISLTPSDIRAMNDVLAQARQNGEIPHTTSSPMDAQAVVEDYGLLTRLREVRGDPDADRAPDAYQYLRVEVARRIQERDSALSEEESRKEAARRVNNYLQSIEQERFFFDAATSPKSPHSKSSEASLVDVEALGEELLSIVEQAADQTLVDATEPLRSDLRCFKGHNDKYSRLIQHEESIMGALNITHNEHNNTQSRNNDTQSHNNDTFDHLLHHQETIIKALEAMIDPQSKLIHASSENLTLLSGLAAHLSQVIMNLPVAVNQIVSNAVQQQTQAAIRQVMDAQQQAMLSLVEEDSRRQNLDHDILAAKIAEQLPEAKSFHNLKPKSGTRFGRMLKRIFRSCCV